MQLYFFDLIAIFFIDPKDVSPYSVSFYPFGRASRAYQLNLIKKPTLFPKSVDHVVRLIDKGN